MSRAGRWSRRLAESRWGDWGVGIASLAEALAVPVPLELALIPHMLANRTRVWRFATLALAGCLVGAAVGYGIGWLFFESVGRWAVESLGWAEDMETVRGWMESYGFWAVVAIGVTPVPFQAAMLMAGLTGYPFAAFMLAAALARGLRYYGLAAGVLWLGPKLEVVVRKGTGRDR
ncbi:DedA family protein [Marivibrio halodurans]|uniref:DedA family protein n=1 Tax=Marivibrio halodurans TaxID=2039722 RepID=A0A8J7S6L9_9PROT|nr:DedA family protein [Marivibrio halodurans]